MPDSLYYCTQENNTCHKKENCKRYLQAKDNACTTLFKLVCNKDNNYILFIEFKGKTEGGENTCQN